MESKKVRICQVLFYTGIALLLLSCGSEGNNQSTKQGEQPSITVPVFNADSSFQYVKRQVNAGPRVPGSEVHKKVGDYLVAKLESYGAEVIEQEFDAVTYDGNQVPLRNIIAAFFPERTKRILLAAHWDTRPFADKDPEDDRAAFDGANDGASGVGVLLEIARQLSKQAPPNVGVDIIFFDGEDWGEHNKEGMVNPGELDSWWCLGSQYWSANKHTPNYSAYYGILLDMVGAKGSQFHKEGISMKYAPRIVRKVWETASRLGYSGIFVNREQGEILDDHRYVNMVAKIPMIDIVHYDPSAGYFGDYHHSRKDNLDLIDRNMLKIVGSTVLNVIFYE